MKKEDFNGLMESVQEIGDFLQGAREGYRVHIPESVDIKALRKKLNMTQAAFAETFRFSLDTVKHWESGRRTPEAPTRAYLKVIERNPRAVLEALTH